MGLALNLFGLYSVVWGDLPALFEPSLGVSSAYTLARLLSGMTPVARLAASLLLDTSLPEACAPCGSHVA